MAGEEPRPGVGAIAPPTAHCPPPARGPLPARPARPYGVRVMGWNAATGETRKTRPPAGRPASRFRASMRAGRPVAGRRPDARMLARPVGRVAAVPS